MWWCGVEWIGVGTTRSATRRVRVVVVVVFPRMSAWLLAWLVGGRENRAVPRAAGLSATRQI
jgi:hypothetical protein